MTGMLWSSRSLEGWQGPRSAQLAVDPHRGPGSQLGRGGKANDEECMVQSPCGTCGLHLSLGVFPSDSHVRPAAPGAAPAMLGGPWSAWRWDPLPSQAAGEVLMYSGDNAKGESFPTPGQALGFPGCFPCISKPGAVGSQRGLFPSVGAWLQPGMLHSQEQSTAPSLAACHR